MNFRTKANSEMKNISLDLSNLKDFYSNNEFSLLAKKFDEINSLLHNKTGKGNEFLGWLNLPSSITKKEIGSINLISEELKSKVDFVVVIGIGGSYLGSRAIIEALSDTFHQYKVNGNYPQVLYAGQNIGEDYMYELLSLLKDKSFAIVVISKSGTTTEPAIAFRLLKAELEKSLSASEVNKRIIAITDKSRGALKQLANQENYRTFDIPDDVGGRFSVLTAVGLLPIAIAGFDIEKLLEGARDMEKATSFDVSFENNMAAKYAVARNVLYNKGKTTEILVNYNSKLHYIAEWWKQLYGESEGKEGKGIFPASVNFTTDLHSMGQYIQDGVRNLFETVISVNETNQKLQIPTDKENLDKLNYIAGKGLDEVNKMAELGTKFAHLDGNVPVIRIEIPKINEYYLGQLIYFYEIACAISGYYLDVNPFDQPGVEAYKTNMFALLGKAGFEEETKKMKKRIRE